MPIVTNQSVWVKRVIRCFDRLQRWTHLRLISDNKEEFDPFIIEIGEVKKIATSKTTFDGNAVRREKYKCAVLKNTKLNLIIFEQGQTK